MQARLNGVVVADSDETVVVEGNHYFPRESIVAEHFTPTALKTHCVWKGEASYFSVSAAGETAENAAWTYEQPSPAADNIRGYVAFARAIDVG